MINLNSLISSTLLPNILRRTSLMRIPGFYRISRTILIERRITSRCTLGRSVAFTMIQADCHKSKKTHKTNNVFISSNNSQRQQRNCWDSEEMPPDKFEDHFGVMPVNIGCGIHAAFSFVNSFILSQVMYFPYTQISG